MKLISSVQMDLTVVYVEGPVVDRCRRTTPKKDSWKNDFVRLTYTAESSDCISTAASPV